MAERDEGFEARLAQIAEFENLLGEAIEVLTDVLLHPHLGSYQPQLDALLGALDYLEMDVGCGDCVEGRCHWGGKRSQESIAAVKAGREFEEACGCARHEASVDARARKVRLKEAGIVGVHPHAAWRMAALRKLYDSLKNGPPVNGDWLLHELGKAVKSEGDADA